MANAGVFSAAGVKNERGKYGLPEIVDSGRQIHLVSESFIEQKKNRSLSVSGDLELRLAYGGGGLQHLLGSILFSHLDKSPFNLGGGLYLHYFEPDEKNRSRNASVWDSVSPSGKFVGKRLTVLVERGNVLAEIVSFQPKNLSFDIGESARVNVSGEAARLNTNTNQSSTNLNFTYSPVGLVLLNHGNVKLIPLHKFSFSADQTIDITENGSVLVTVTIPAGNYYAVQLARELEKQLNNNTSLNGNYSVNWDGSLLSFTIISNTEFRIDGGSVVDYLGFVVPTNYGYIHRSDKPAKYDAVNVNGITAKISSLSLVIDTGIERVGTAETAWEIDEAFPVNPQNIRLTLNFHRPIFENVGELAGEHFAFKATFTHPDGVGEMEFVIENMRLVTPEASVSGEQIIKERLAFEPVDTDFREIETVFDNRFMVRQLPVTPSGGASLAVGAYKNKLYVSDELQGFYRLDDNGFVSLPGTGDPIFSMVEWNGLFYLGTESGELYYYDGSNTVLIGSAIASGNSVGVPLIALTPFNDKLYILDSNGALFFYDGNTIQQDSSAPSATSGHDMMSINGKLYIIVTDSVSTKIHSFDSNSWVLEYDFTTIENTGSFAFLQMRKRIYSAAGRKIVYFDIPTNSWQTAPFSLSETVKHLCVIDSELITVSSTGNIYWFRSNTLDDVFLAGVGATPHYKPATFERKLVIPIDTQLQYVQLPYIFNLKLKDKTSFNPYL